MLPRASTDAGTRLRHTKSTSSVRSRRNPTTVAEPSDPFIVREHATAAAVQAFERAYALDRTRSRAEQSLELARRMSTASRGSQGSHFPPRGSSLRQAGEESAVKSRKSVQYHRYSTEKHQNNSPRTAAAPVATPQHQLRKHMLTSSVASAPSLPKENVPNVSPSTTATASASKQIRKSRSMYTSWNLGFGTSRDAPQDATVESVHFTSQRLKDVEIRSVVDASFKDNLASQRISEAPSAEEVTAARDRALQDFQKNRLRTRPSFAFTPFRKRQGDQQHIPSATYEVTLSPHETSPLGVTVPAAIPAKGEEKRSFSGSLKTRLKKVFRKTSKPVIQLPAQQVDATRAYFGNSISTAPTDATSCAATGTPPDYFTYGDMSRPSSRQRVSSDISNHLRKSTEDHDMSDISKSRVTSWTNSSVTNSTNSRDPKRLSIIPEIDPASEKKRSNSILSRSPFRKPLHTSPPGVTKGPDSFDVFSALKTRLEKAGLDSNLDPDLPISGTRLLHEQTERAMLPSQTRNSSNTSKLSRATKATIRTVTPQAFVSTRFKDRADGGHQQFEDDEGPRHGSPDNEDRGLILPRIRLQRAAKATIPTPEQIPTRKKRSGYCWQPQLGQCNSPVYSKNTRKAMVSDTSYERAPLDQTPSPPKRADAPPRTSSRKLQESVDMLSPNWPSRADIMSPSVYSRDSSGESPVRKESSGSDCPLGTVVIVSSHSAKSYTLESSPKKGIDSRSVHNSKDWKNWLSKEVSELDLSQNFDMSMMEEWLLKPAGHQREHAEIIGVGEDEDEVVVFKSRPASNDFSNRPERLTLIDSLGGGAGGQAVSTSEEGVPGVGTSTRSGEAVAADTERKASEQNQKSNGSGSGGEAQVRHGSERSKSSRGGNSMQESPSDDSNKVPEPAPASPPESEEKIPLIILTDKVVHHTPSYRSINQSASLSHSSLAQYTTSVEDPDMQCQSGAALLRASPSLYTAPVANPTFRFRPADPCSSTSAIRSSPFSRPRSAFDLRNQYSCAGLRSAAATAGAPPSNTSSAATLIATGPTLLLPPPPHHTHHLRRKPVTVGARHGGNSHLAPSPSPAPSLEGDTMQMIMQGPYSSSSSSPADAGRGIPESVAISASQGVHPPLALSTSSRFQPPPLASAHHHWNKGGAPTGHHLQPALLASRQSTPALRVTPRRGSVRRLAGVGVIGQQQQQQQGAKENAVPVPTVAVNNNGVASPHAKTYAVGGEDVIGGGRAEMQQQQWNQRERGTPSPGQLLAERWLCARGQQKGDAAGGGGAVVDGGEVSPAFL